MRHTIYLDHNATTRPRPEVVEAMLPHLKGHYGNASSLYALGQEERKAIDLAREQVARLIGAARPDEVVFTGGGSESINWAIKGVALAHRDKGRHLVTTKGEHSAALKSSQYLETLGWRVSWLELDGYGRVDPEQVRSAITKETVLVSIHHANNETGTLQPVDAIARVCRESGVLLHVDALQTVGKIPVSVDALDCNLLSLGAHKFYGPKGVGALYIRPGTRLHPFIHGGSHERNRRAGTENVAAIAGMGVAAERATETMTSDEKHVRRLRDKLERELLKRIDCSRVNGDPERRMFNTSHISVEAVEGEGLIVGLDLQGICVSSGSACASGATEPSHVLLAMGVPVPLAKGSLRFSLGRENTDDEIERVIEILPGIVERLRGLSPLWGGLPDGPAEIHDHGTTRQMSRGKVIVAMSGGVDSSVAAALLKDQGYEVYGVTMRLSDWESTEGRTFGGCCGSTDFYDARAVAQSLGIPHYSLNYVDAFKGSVIGYFKDSYLHGETPNPCIACNQFVKFDRLLQQAVALGADWVATGHYARIEKTSVPWQGTRDKRDTNSDSACRLPHSTCHYVLKRAVDPSKDQSYVLYHLSQAELSKLLFPLGGLPKSEVREIARRLGLKVAAKPDSQEICFVPNQDYKQFIREEVPEDQRRPGPIRHVDGRVLGNHQGLPFYTIGQREGLGLAVGKPLYVTALDPRTNTVVVGDKDDVLATRMRVRDVRWMAGVAPSLPLKAQVKIRYKHREADALIRLERETGRVGGGAVVVEFDAPQSAITPGQAAVFYNGDVVLGGGVIDQVV